LKPHSSQELRRIASIFDHQPATLDPGRDLLELIEHDAPDPLPAEFSLHNNVVYQDDVWCDLHLKYCDQLAEELAEQATGRNLGPAVVGKERADGVVIC
jgi:hypothetical protein